MINSQVFSDRNSSKTIEEIAKRDNEEMARIVNMVRFTTMQHGYSPQSEYISFDLYSENEEKLKEKKIEALSEKIEFDTPLEVRTFLLEKDFLIRIVYEAVEKIRGIFKSEKLKLVLESDPEMATDSKVLSLKILTEMDPTKVINLLDKLNNEWWLEIKPRTRQKLIIEEEYV